MKRYYIVEGDKTTAGGIVQKHTGSGSTTSWHGKTVSNIDDKIDCPACNSVGKIQPVGDRQSFGNRGFIPALNDDLCICKCSPPPKLIHSQTVFYQNISDNVSTASSISSEHGASSQNNFKNNLVDDKKHDNTTCFCNKDITLDLLKAILPSSALSVGLFSKSAYPKIKNMDINVLLESLNKVMKEYEINTCLRKAHFLAQISVEGDHFKTTEEYKNKEGGWNNYHGGQQYHGRGLIQLTHIENYERFGKSIKIDFVPNNIGLVASEPEYAISSASWYWKFGSTWGNGNEYADKDDIHYITMLINGGFNGYCERKSNLIKLIGLMKIKENCKNIKELNHNLGEYTFSKSKLATSNVGKRIWHNYHTNETLKVNVKCERE